MAVDISPEDATNAASALAAAVKGQSTTDATQINTQAGALAPGLAETGTNAPGGYNNLRTIVPVAPTLADQMVIAAKRGVFKLQLQKAQNDAKVNYDAAQASYQDRQQDYYRRQAEEARRQAAAAVFQSSLGGAAAGSEVSEVGVTTTPSPKIASNGKGGYNFFDANGKAISWQAYDKLMGTDSSSMVKGTGPQKKMAAPAPVKKVAPAPMPAPFSNIKIGLVPKR